MLLHAPYHFFRVPRYANQASNPIAERGTAVTQKSHWPSFMFRMSAVFMPRTLANIVSGRKKTVTVVNVRAAFSCRSLAVSMVRKCCER